MSPTPHGLRSELDFLARSIWTGRLSPSIQDWAHAVSETGDGPLSIAIRLSTAIRENAAQGTPVDADDFACAFGSACLALGIRVKLLCTLSKEPGLGQASVLVAVLITSTPDEKEPWISHDTWWAFGVDGVSPWPMGALVVDPLFWGES